MLYLAVTADEYELPIAVRDTAPQLAAAIGVTTTAIYNAIYRENTGSCSKMRIRRIELEDEQYD